MAEVTAKLNKLDIAPRKVRSVIRIISGLPVADAEAQLVFRKERAARPILKLLRSAVANAKNKGLNAEGLYVSSIWADEGPTLKRWLPRARGIATPLHKKFSHVTIVLSEGSKKSRFSMVSPSSKKAVKGKKPKGENRKDKKNKPAKTKKTVKKDVVSESSGASKTESPIKKIFRRKPV